MSEIDTSLAALRALAIKLDDVYPHKDSDGWIIDETVYALRALADEKEAAGNDATLATVRARLLAAEEARDAARSEAKDEAAGFIFGVLEGALGNPAYNPCDGTETWDGDVAGTVYCILNASGIRNEDTGELATARAEKMRVALLKILRTTSNGMRWEDKVFAIEETASSALAETAGTPAAPPADDGWIKWEGGECPVPNETRTEVRLRSGNTYVARNPEGLWWKWGQTGLAEIVAYRIVEARNDA